MRQGTYLDNMSRLDSPHSEMTRSTILTVLLCTAVAALSDPTLNKQIIVQGLIGSHFGVPGLLGSYEAATMLWLVEGPQETRLPAVWRPMYRNTVAIVEA